MAGQIALHVAEQHGAYSWVAQLGTEQFSWTAPVDATRLERASSRYGYARGSLPGALAQLTSR
jgi:hypothetical protein